MMFLSFSPLIPLPLFWLLVAASAMLAVLWLFTKGWSALWRAAALILLCLALLNPSIIKEDREPVKSIVAVVIDKSGSQSLGEREKMAETAREEIAQSLSKRSDLEPRFIEVADDANDGGTLLFSALSAGLADLPPNRIAGAVIITDGIIHDVPDSAEKLPFQAPIHVLVTGRPDEHDRQVRFLQTPRFGIVGKQMELRAVVDERGGTGSARISIRLGGREIAAQTVRTEVPFSFPVTIDHAGSNVVEISVDSLTDELTTLNNRAVLDIEGVRDRLRVLLISGEPHPGERTWRNLLKSDANVELVHFTILRPVHKADATPIDELSLIEFPFHDLFINKIHDFDLIIFDRYANQGNIPPLYFASMEDYVKNGGAILVAAGPEYAGTSSLASTSLGDLFPARPTGRILEQAFRPTLTDVGNRHPVTRGLTGSAVSPPDWGEWMRLIGTDAAPEQTLMAGPSGAPLLVLSHAGNGRVAMLLSDQVWLWARSYERGGPYLDFQRRLAHWLMKEPALEEEALRASVNGHTITIEQQSMKGVPAGVTLQSPSGATRDVTMQPSKPGLFSAEIEAREMGLHTVKSGDLVAFASVGPANPREFIDVFSDTERVRSLVESTRGSVRRIGVAGSAVPVIPRIETAYSGSRLAGSNWIGFKAGDNAIIRGVSVSPIGIGLLAALLLAGAALVAWLVEGRRRF